jgi:hypothetical protein
MSNLTQKKNEISIKLKQKGSGFKQGKKSKLALNYAEKITVIMDKASKTQLLKLIIDDVFNYYDTTTLDGKFCLKNKDGTWIKFDNEKDAKDAISENNKELIIKEYRRYEKIIKINKKISSLKLEKDLNNNRIDNIKKIKKDLQQKQIDISEKRLDNLEKMNSIIERETLNILEASKVANAEIQGIQISNSEMLKEIIKINENKIKNKNKMYKQQLYIGNLDSEISSKTKEYYDTHNSDLILQQQKIYAKKQEIIALESRDALENLSKYTVSLGKTQLDGLNSITKSLNLTTESLNKGLTELNKGFSNGLNGINNSMMSISNQFLGLQATIMENNYSSLDQTLKLEDIKLIQANKAQEIAIEQQYKTQIATAFEMWATATAIASTDNERANEIIKRTNQILSDAKDEKDKQLEQLQQQLQQQRITRGRMMRQIEYLKEQSELLREKVDDEKDKLAEYLKKQGNKEQGEEDDEDDEEDI